MSIIMRYTEWTLYMLLGLLPQLMGVAPGKAIKLTMNFTMRDFLTSQGWGITSVERMHSWWKCKCVCLFMCVCVCMCVRVYVCAHVCPCIAKIYFVAAATSIMLNFVSGNIFLTFEISTKRDIPWDKTQLHSIFSCECSISAIKDPRM